MPEYRKFKTFQLQSEAKRRNLQCSDNKKELIAALVKNGIRYPSAISPPLDYLSFTADPNIYSDFMIYQLQDYCLERSLSVSGLKYEVIDRMLEDDMGRWDEAHSEIADATDDDRVKRLRLLKAKTDYALKQKDVKLKAHTTFHTSKQRNAKSEDFKYHQNEIAKARTAVQAEKNAIKQDGKDDEETLRSQFETRKRAVSEASVAANDSKLLLSDRQGDTEGSNSSSLSEVLGEELSKFSDGSSLSDVRSANQGGIFEQKSMAVKVNIFPLSSNSFTSLTVPI